MYEDWGDATDSEDCDPSASDGIFQYVQFFGKMMKQPIGVAKETFITAFLLDYFPHYAL